MKETFIQFLKDNNFYEGWMEGYKIDNEVFEDVVPLEKFFRKVQDRLWLYSGPQAMALLGNRPEDNGELQKRYDEWREKWLGTYIDLDQKWMDLVTKKKKEE